MAFERDLGGLTAPAGPFLTAGTRRKALEDASGIAGGPGLDFSSGEAASLEGIEALARGDLGGLSSDALRNVLTQTGPAFDTFFNEGVRGPALRDFNEEILPTLDQELARSGFFGSARGNRLEDASQELIQFLTEQRARTKLESLQVQLAASQAIPAELNILLSALAAGGAPRAAEDARIGRLLGIAGTNPEQSEFGGGGGGGGGGNTAATITALGQVLSAIAQPRP